MKKRDQVEQQLRDPPGTRILRIEWIVCGHLVTRTTTKAQKEERKEKATEANWGSNACYTRWNSSEKEEERFQIEFSGARAFQPLRHQGAARQTDTSGLKSEQRSPKSVCVSFNKPVDRCVLPSHHFPTSYSQKNELFTVPNHGCHKWIFFLINIFLDSEKKITERKWNANHRLEGSIQNTYIKQRNCIQDIYFLNTYTFNGQRWTDPSQKRTHEWPMSTWTDVLHYSSRKCEWKPQWNTPIHTLN